MNPTSERKPDLLNPAIRQKLGRLRTVLRLYLATDGLARLVVVVAVAALATLVVDWGLFKLVHKYLTVGQRVLLDACALSAVGYVACRWLLRPLSLPMSDDDLALVVERRHGELGDRLISTLQLSQSEPARRGGASAWLIDRLAEQTNELAGRMDFADALSARGVARRVVLALLAVVSVTGLAAWRSDLVEPWLRRIVLLQDARYPQATYLSLAEGQRLKAMRGGPLEIVIEAETGPRRVVPASVTLSMQFPSVGNVREEITGQSDAPQRFVKRFEMVTESFRFSVTGNDAQTETFEVEVAEGPQLTGVTFHVVRPPYMRVGPETLSGGEGTPKIAEQSWVTVQGVASKDLAAARVLLADQAVGQAEILPVGGDGVGAQQAGRPRAVSARFQLPRLDPFRPMLPLAIELTDTEGFNNPRGAQYTIAVQRDKPPTVQMETRGIGNQITRRAVVPLAFTVKDDYGVVEVELQWAPESQRQRISSERVERFEPPLREPKTVTFELDLEAIDKRDGPSPRTSPQGGEGENGPPPLLEVGDSLRLLGVVRDSLPEPLGPNVGTTESPIVLKIVPEEELWTALIEAQSAASEQLRQVLAMQKEVREKTVGGARLAAMPSKLPAAQRAAAEAADSQKEIRDRVASVADRFFNILQQMDNNRIGADTDKLVILEKVVNPLRQIVAGPMKDLPAELSAAATQRDAEALAAELKRIGDVQQTLISQLHIVLGEMSRVEKAQQLEKGFRMVIQKTEEVKEITKGKRK